MRSTIEIKTRGNQIFLGGKWADMPREGSFFERVEKHLISHNICHNVVSIEEIDCGYSYCLSKVAYNQVQ